MPSFHYGRSLMDATRVVCHVINKICTLRPEPFAVRAWYNLCTTVQTTDRRSLICITAVVVTSGLGQGILNVAATFRTPWLGCH